MQFLTDSVLYKFLGRRGLEFVGPMFEEVATPYNGTIAFLLPEYLGNLTWRLTYVMTLDKDRDNPSAEATTLQVDLNWIAVLLGNWQRR